MYYTYIDWTLEEVPRPFYVGKGNQNRIRLVQRNRKHEHVRKRYGYQRKVVYSASEVECLQKEVDLIAEHHTYIHDPFSSEIACNFTLGGEGVSGWNKGKCLSEEHRRKISSSLTGVKHSPERTEKTASKLRGGPNLKSRKEWNPEKGKKISLVLTGRPLSDEHKRSVSDSLKRYMAQRGEWHPSEEARQRMSEAQKTVGAQRTKRASIDASHSDAQVKECPVCHCVYGPKKLTASWVKRHAVKRWCSRKCGRIGQNVRTKQ